MPKVLPGTKLLTFKGDIPDAVMDGAHKFIDAKIIEFATQRKKFWNLNYSSALDYMSSLESNRNRLMHYLGIEDKNQPLINYNQGLPDEHPQISMQRFSFNNDAEIVAETSTYRVYQVRWPVLNKVYGEGLLLQPKEKPIANIIVLPDADQIPEQLVGLAPGISEKSQFPRWLVENGYQVLIPVLVSREHLFPGSAKQQTYREWLYRQSFHTPHSFNRHSNGK